MISPGGAYGPNGEGFFRISLTVPDERLAEAVERMRDSLAAARCTTAASSPCRASLQLAMLEEVREPEPPIRLNALFYEPGSAAEVAGELHKLGDVVIGVGAPLAGPRDGRPGRDCDALLLRRGVAPQAAHPGDAAAVRPAARPADLRTRAARS